MAQEDWMLARACGCVETKRRILSLSPTIPLDFDKEAYFSYKCDNLIALRNDTVFDLGGLTVRPVPLPSHSPGSVGFLCPELNILLGGDSIAPLTCLVFPECLDIADHVKLLNAVKELPFSWILSSHSGRLIPKIEMDLYIKCAESVNPEKAVLFNSSLYPNYPGKMYSYENPLSKGEYAFVVLP